MTALKANEVERFLKRPDLDEGVLLIYGPDSGLVREVAQKLVRHYGGNDAGSMNLVTLDGSEVDSEPGRLLIEAKTSSLFGDKRVVRVRGAGKGAVMGVTELLDDPSGAAIVLEAGNLTPRDALRALVEGSKRGPRPALLSRYRRNADPAHQRVARRGQDQGRPGRGADPTRHPRQRS